MSSNKDRMKKDDELPEQDEWQERDKRPIERQEEETDIGKRSGQKPRDEAARAGQGKTNK